VTALAPLALATLPADAGPVPGQGTWQTTLHARDLDGNGTADADYDSSLNVTWLRDWSLARRRHWRADRRADAAHDLPGARCAGGDGWHASAASRLAGRGRLAEASDMDETLKGRHITIDPTTTARSAGILRAVANDRQGCLGVHDSTVAPGRVALEDSVVIESVG
jgi:hypothetical protein